LPQFMLVTRLPPAHTSELAPRHEHGTKAGIGNECGGVPSSAIDFLCSWSPITLPGRRRASASSDFFRTSKYCRPMGSESWSHETLAARWRGSVERRCPGLQHAREDREFIVRREPVSALRVSSHIPEADGFVCVQS
jgi:hypothetical protein